MSGVTPSPPFSRLVLELLGGYFSGCCDRRPPAPSALPFARRGPRWCSVPPTCEYPILCPLSQGTRTDFGAQGSVNDPIVCGSGGDGCNPIAVPFVVKGNGNKTAEILLF